MRWHHVISFGLFGLAGCGGGGSSADAGPDAHPLAGSYDDPSDFGDLRLLNCTPGSLAGILPDGVFHHDNTVDNAGSFPGVTHYMSASGIVQAWTNAIEMAVTHTDDDLFLRREWYVDGAIVVRTYDVCALGPGGSMSGILARCNNNGCTTGTFRQVPVRRITGELDQMGVSFVSAFAGDTPWADGEAVNVRVVNGVAYLARYQDGLRIVDVSDPAAPHDLGHVATGSPGEIWNDVKIVDGPGARRYALVASNVLGVITIDVTNPQAPAVVGQPYPPFPSGSEFVNVHTLFTETIGTQTRAYLANTSIDGLDIYDISDPLAPVKLGSYVHPDEAGDPAAYVHDLYVENGRAYLDYWSLGFVVVDTLTDPANPQLVGQFDAYARRTNHSSWVTTAGGRKVAVVGDEDFGAHVRIIDVDDASTSFMQQIGELQLRPEVSVHNIMALGDRAYIAWYQDGVRVLDLSDPTQPTVVAYANTWSEPLLAMSFYEGAVGIDVDLAQKLIYVADIPRGLLVYRLP